MLRADCEFIHRNDAQRDSSTDPLGSASGIRRDPPEERPLSESPARRRL